MPVETTPAVTAAFAAQIGLLLSGCWVLWRFQRRRQGSVPARLSRWEISGFEFALAAFFVLSGAFAGQLLMAMVPIADPDHQLIAQSAGFQGGLLLGVGASALALRRPRPAESAAEPAPSALVAGGLTFLGCLPIVFLVAAAWNFVLERLGFPIERQDMLGIFSRAESPLLVALMVFLVVIVAPVVEELVFRAGLFRFLRLRVPRGVALVLPAVVFGSLHGNLVAVVPLATLGIIFSLAYERTGRIAVPIIAHALFNLNTVVLVLLGVTAET